ncbi:MAG: TIGR02281 family clan AA aspartic protease [Caulobacteraceae bacterium]
MLKHVGILGAAVVVALVAAQQMIQFEGHQNVAQAAPAQVAPLQVASGAAASGDTSTTQDAPTAAAALPANDGEASAPSSAAEVSKARDGHYWAEAEVDGHWIHCLIDTGASVVALTRADAERLGLDAENLNYDAPLNTANGLTHAARVELDYVSVSGARVERVPAVVVHDGLSASLLGMSYLGRLSRFEATPAALILRP